MEKTFDNRWIYTVGGIACLSALFFLTQDSWYLFLLPVILIGIYAAIFHTAQMFLALFFLTPISVNLEEWVEGIGLFVPTEPLLAGLTLLAIALQIRKNFIPSYLWKSPLLWSIAFYLFWLILTTITSSNPLVSMKVVIAKSWYIIPIFAFGTGLFSQRKMIITVLWLFVIGMTLSMLYTLFHHAIYRFGEKEGHWVMSPFFKDHTIYGAMVAFNLPIVIGLFLSRKHSPLLQAILIALSIINVIALYFSYTRAAWLSIIIAMGVWMLIRLKIKLSWLLSAGAIVGIIIFFSWTSIMHSLAKNKAEHTTENFGERLESVSNVTTDASNLERLNRWSCAWDMFLDRPVFGFGSGTYSFEYARFQRPENLTIISTNFGNLGNAHSEYLGPLAETGFIGLISVLLIIITMFYLSINTYLAWPESDKEMKVLMMAMILALVTYFFHGFLNNYWDTDKASVPIWSFCAVFITLNYQLTSGWAAKKT